MKLLLKRLILAITIPYQIMAMENRPTPSAPPLEELLYPIVTSDPSYEDVFPNYPPPTYPAPTILDYITIPLPEANIAHVERCSKNSALAFALLGGYATGSYIGKYYKPSLPERLLISGIGAFSSGFLAYVATKWFTTNSTHEKQDEAVINRIIYLNNKACETSAQCSLNNEERARLKDLLAKDQKSPQNRISVYDYTLKLNVDKPSLQRISSNYPIFKAVNFLDEIQTQLWLEKNDLNYMETKNPQLKSVLAPDKKSEFERIMKQVNETQKAIQDLNEILPSKTISQWTYNVKKHPEYMIDSLQREFADSPIELKRREMEVIFQLRKLAALKSPLFFQEFLPKKYDDTPEGLNERMSDIDKTKKNIHQLMKDYETNVEFFNHKVGRHNDAIAETDDTIISFVNERGGKANKLAEYQANQELLSYKNYVDSTANCLILWINRCFNNRAWQ